MARKEFKPQLQPEAEGSAADIAALFDLDEPAVLAPPPSPGSSDEDELSAQSERPAPPLEPSAAPQVSTIAAVRPATPDEKLAADGGGYVPIFTYLGADAEAQMHVAAYARGGEAAKSLIVREALDVLRRQLDELPADERAALLGQIRRAEADDRSRTSRIYRIKPDQKEWLHALAGAERVPMAATVRWAIDEQLGISTADASTERR